MTKECRLVLTEYYKKQRNNRINREASRTTIRMLESLIRLAQAHAKLMYRDDVLLQDAIFSIFLMECSMQNSILFPHISTVKTMFPNDPETEYFEHEAIVLAYLEFTGKNFNNRLTDYENNYDEYHNDENNNEENNEGIEKKRETTN